MGVTGVVVRDLVRQLARDLQKRRRELGGRVPVMLPAAAWHPGSTVLPEWIAQQLSISYHIGPGTAQQLVAAGKIIPILDGLDENLDPTEALFQLHEWAGRDKPFILTCRKRQYLDAHANHGPLAMAAVIELLALLPDDVIAYLDPDCDSRWRSLREHLAAFPDSPLAAVLSSALMVGLVRHRYRDSTLDPGELLEFDSPEAITAFLLDEFIPLAFAAPDLVHTYGHNTTRQQRRRNKQAGKTEVEDAQKWLTHLANWLNKRETTTIAWWELHLTSPNDTTETTPQHIHSAAPTRKQTLATSLTSGLAVGLASGLASGLGVGLGTKLAYELWKWLRVGLASGPADGLMAGLMAGLMVGLVVGLGVWLRAGPLAGLAAALGGGLAAGLTVGLPGGLEAGLLAGVAIGMVTGMGAERLGRLGAGLGAGPAAGLSAGMGAGLGAGLSAGLAFGLAYALSSGLMAVGLYIGLGFGLGVGLSVGLGVWLAVALGAGMAAALATGMGTGLVGALGAGLVSGLVAALVSGLAVGLVFGLSVGLEENTQTRTVPSNSIDPVQAYRLDRHYTRRLSTITLTITMISGLAAGLMITTIGNWLLAGPTVGLAAGLMWVQFNRRRSAIKTAWLQHQLTRYRLARNNQLPRDVMGFLEIAHQRGVLRQTGSYYQFRHEMLQQHLTRQQAQP